MTRDIDDWMFHFERQAGPRLKALFEANLESLPPALASRLQKLRNVEDPQAHHPNTADERHPKR
ncbi:hypothetical protein [Hyphomicrobium sp. 2TAF46]|uniref:hypothetical protein n=1 Tax=Hyphomicrobium sp. 2TAF46 TaxID=3233019 RepID=UPI003F8DE84B